MVIGPHISISSKPGELIKLKYPFIVVHNSLELSLQTDKLKFEYIIFLFHDFQFILHLLRLFFQFCLLVAIPNVPIDHQL